MSEVIIRPAIDADIDGLDDLEQQSFHSDRLSRRRLKHWIRAKNRVFLVASQDSNVLGYGLVLLHRGTRLARLYSLAVSSHARGLGLGRKLLLALEKETADKKRFFMRLEVATDNEPAIGLYQSLGYSRFACISDYYEDHRDALRMQKRIRYISENLQQKQIPWYQQSMDFSCGPAALLMAMASLNKDIKPSLEQELDIWREATTIFMTSGHGGCHPIGLALAAQKRGVQAQVYLNQSKPLFLDSVRNPLKKDIMSVADTQFRTRAKELGVSVKKKEVHQKNIETWLHKGASIIILISTYRLDGKKSPHWVTVSGIDDQCLYVHDPDPIDEKYLPIDCQHVPIAREDFSKMSVFGTEKLRTCVVLWPQNPK